VLASAALAGLYRIGGQGLGLEGLEARTLEQHALSLRLPLWY